MKMSPNNKDVQHCFNVYDDVHVHGDGVRYVRGGVRDDGYVRDDVRDDDHDD